MTAFAAVVSLDGGPLADVDQRSIGHALSLTTGTVANQWEGGSCALLAAPLHPWDAPGIKSTLAGVTVTGVITLEGRRDVAQSVNLDPTASSIDVVAAAVERCGTHAASRLRGEYAFAAWNGTTRQLICARDALGLRVLYTGRNDRSIIVSNVIDAVLAHTGMSRAHDSRAWARFLRNGTFTNGVTTPYSAVRMVPAGHTLVIGADARISLSRHWRPPQVGRSVPTCEAAICEGFRHALGDALHDRVDDHSWSLLLSGGLDSPALAALGAGRGGSIHAVTFGYQLPSVADEPRLAAAVAARFTIPWEPVDALAFTALEAERAGATAAVPVDEPMLANWRHGLNRAAAHSTLVVHGDDGDALLAPPGGAGLFAVQLPRAVAVESAKYVARERRLPYLGIRLRERLGIGRRQPAPPPVWLSSDATRLLDDDPLTVFGTDATSLDGDDHVTDTWQRLLRNVPCDFALAVDPGVTRERVALTFPMMDERVISYVSSLPPIPWRQRKHLLRAAFSDRLPAEVLRRPKTPVAELDMAVVTAWRTQHLASTLHAPISELIRPWLDVSRWHHALSHGNPLEVRAAWRVLILDRWLRASGANG